MSEQRPTQIILRFLYTMHRLELSDEPQAVGVEDGVYSIGFYACTT